jgi:hypothetical protein
MKTKEYKPISAAQIKLVHVLLQQQGLMEQKKTLIHSISDGRTHSTKELTSIEAKALIDLLQEANEVSEKKKAIFRAVYGLAWKIDMIYGDTDDDYRMNVAKLNVFCRERGTVKKNLTEQTLAEMRKTQRQFEAMYRKHDKKRKEVVNGTV